MIMTKLIMLREQARDFFAGEEGASAIEYSIIAGLIAVAIVTAAGLLGTEVSSVFGTIKDELAKVKP